MKLISYKYQVGTGFNFAAFVGNIFKLKATESFELSFERLGGEYLAEKPEGFKENVSVWSFPVGVTASALENIIKNTCFQCGGLMKNSTVLDNEEIRVLTSNGYIPYKEGPAVVKHCRKCVNCGHSHT